MILSQFSECSTPKQEKASKIMLFKKELIEKILEGKKTMTSRKKKLCEEGEVTNLMANKDFSKVTGKYIKITRSIGRFLANSPMKIQKGKALKT